MILRYVIHLARGFCRCFSDSDLKVNIEFCLRHGYRIVAVERVSS